MTSYNHFFVESPIRLGEWIAAFEQTKLFALIDYESLDEEARQLLDANAVNLYGDLEGTGIASQGPRLIEVPGVDESSLLAQCLAGYPVALLLGRCELSELSAHLREIREVLVPEETRALFRYQDINVVRALFPLLLPVQGQLVVGPLVAWGVLDACRVFHTLFSDGRKGKSGQLRTSCGEVRSVRLSLSLWGDEASGTGGIGC